MLSNGKSVPVRLTSDIYTKSKTAVEPIAVVDADIKSDDGSRVLIRRGTPVNIDAKVQRARGVGKPASVRLLFLSTTAVDGQTVRLQGGYNATGDSRRGLALGVGLGVGLTVCWPCLFCLCIKGENVTVPENTVFSNVVTNDSYAVTVR